MTIKHSIFTLHIRDWFSAGLYMPRSYLGLSTCLLCACLVCENLPKPPEWEKQTAEDLIKEQQTDNGPPTLEPSAF